MRKLTWRTRRFTWRTRSFILALFLALLVALSPGLAGADGGAAARIKIPIIGLDEPLVSVGLDDGNPIVTHDDVDWWDGSTAPGNMGNSVFWGHFIKLDGSAGPFYKLMDVALGDEIVVTSEMTRVYVVTYIAIYDDQTVEYMLPTSWERLTLITCAGRAYWSGGKWQYPNRLVVMAVPKAKP